jgi:hypothetical protein
MPEKEDPGARLPGGSKVSDSFKNALKATVLSVLALVLCLALVMGVVACGGDDSGTATTSENGTATGDGAGTATTDGTTGPSGGSGSSFLVGKWTSVTLAETWEFAADGTMTITTEGDDPIAFTYSTEGDTLVLVVDGSVEEFSMGYSIAGDVLTIEDAELGETDYERAD